MAEHRLRIFPSLYSAITSGAFWTYIKKLFYVKSLEKNLSLRTGNIGLQKCMIYFYAKLQKGVQISIQKQELRAADDN